MGYLASSPSPQLLTEETAHCTIIKGLRTRQANCQCGRFADLAGTESVVASGFTFDAGGRLTGLAHGTLATYGWTYDAGNRLTHMTSPDGAGDYTYDATDQLVGADYNYQTDEAYAFDANGNRVGTGYVTGTNNQTLSDGVYNYAYDAEGNRALRTHVASGATTEYTWDHRNRLTGIVDKNGAGVVTGSVGYRYDPFNRRISKVIAPGVGPAELEHFAYDGGSRAADGDRHIVLQLGVSGAVTHRYLHGPAVDQVLADEQVDPGSGAADVLWPLTDHLGSVRDLAEYDDATGITSIANHIVYGAFGGVMSESNANVDCAFGFTGRETDPESDLNYYRARYYDPQLGQFVGEDPIGFAAADPNLRRYVGNHPLHATDASGLDEEYEWTGPSMSAAPRRAWTRRLGDWWRDIWNNDYEDPRNAGLRDQDNLPTFVLRRTIHEDVKPIGGGVRDTAKFVVVDVPEFLNEHSPLGLVVVGPEQILDADWQRLEAVAQTAELMQNWPTLPSHESARIAKRLVAGQLTLAGGHLAAVKGLSSLKSASSAGTVSRLFLSESPDGIMAARGVILEPKPGGGFVVVVDEGLAGTTEALLSETYARAGMRAELAPLFTEAGAHELPVLLSEQASVSSRTLIAPRSVVRRNSAGQAIGPDGRFIPDPARVDTPTVSRPYVRQGVREEVLARAPRDAQGRLLDPNTFEVIDGPYHMGHKPGHEWWRIRDRAAEEGWTRQQLIDYLNNPDLIRLNSQPITSATVSRCRDDKFC